MNEQTGKEQGGQRPGCNVSSTFNFVVGALAIVAVLIIGYLGYLYWWK